MYSNLNEGLYSVSVFSPSDSQISATLAASSRWKRQSCLWREAEKKAFLYIYKPIKPEFQSQKSTF